MGVPKFFRYISERYPCLSELIREYQIPEFDNLYLDMNGIIHMCSHPDDNNPHFRITEEQIFQDIFHYIEVLFRMIKPQKLFFMAVDGVAPRAKMNQQRGRRFRSAKDALVLEAKAREKGEELPTEARFDSNCITPGTEFMSRLHEQLKYFVVNKISTDVSWQKCKIILSGHETPGEGEHKIMDYIRYMRSQPGYDPNTRHCLYGLDADLIMLGLCSHEPHFSLLREEVQFGKKSTKRKSVPEQINFYLLHLSLMREYLELEFWSIKDSMPFKYDIEQIIDDWVLMGFLVGNDFIPHLPNMHIANGALPMLYNAYMKVLPTLGGYINESGILNLQRFEKFIEALSTIDVEHFSEQYADLKWFENKTGKRFNEKAKTMKTLEPWDPLDKTELDESSVATALDTLTLNDASDVVPELKIELEDDDNGECEEQGSDTSDNEDDLFNAEFLQHKTDYYMNKLAYENVTPEVLRSQAEGYVRAIQWNLHYYYNGVSSWSWYYPHHYAPYMSDIKGFSNLELQYELGKPFRPYEQLLGVLPAASKTLLPLPYQSLMTDENSPIKDYYPEDFNTDLNGKKQDWEAVVLIPFIDEDELLKAMEPCNKQLTMEEMMRNAHGPMLVFEYTSNNLGEYKSPAYFPPVTYTHALCKPIFIDEIRVPIEKLIKGAYPGAKMDVYYPGFPTLKHLKYTGTLEKAKVKVFEQPSRGESMILRFEHKDLPTADVTAKDLLGKTIYVGWPHLVEALVISVSDKDFRYHSVGEKGQYNVEENKGNLSAEWSAQKGGIKEHYKMRLGVDVGTINILLHVKVMTGRQYTFTSFGRVNLEKQWANITSVYPIQAIVRDINVHESTYTLYHDINSVFPVGTKCFMLGQPYYGAMGEVLDSKETLKNGRIKVDMKKIDEPDLTQVIHLESDVKTQYMNVHTAASKLAISRNMLSRITGCVFLASGSKLPDVLEEVPKINVGLNLKFNKKNEEVPGYTRRLGTTWFYSEKAVDLVNSYMQLCPRLFEYLNSHGNNDVFYENRVFPDGDAKERIKEITSWIKKQPFYSAERQVCGSLGLDPDTVQQLEQTVDQYFNNSCVVKQVIMQVKPHLLYKPDLQIGNLMPDSATTFQLFDRVVNVRQGYTVPFGLKGTIIAIHKPNTGSDGDTTYDVLFDQTFVGGLALNCSSNKGYRLPRPAMINISHGLRALNQKGGKAGKLVQNLQSTKSASVPPNNHYSNAVKFSNQPPPYNIPQNSAFVSCAPGYNNYSNPPVHGYNLYNPNHNNSNFQNSYNAKSTNIQQYANFNSSNVPGSSNNFSRNPPYMPLYPQPPHKTQQMNQGNGSKTQNNLLAAIQKPLPNNQAMFVPKFSGQQTEVNSKSVQDTTQLRRPHQPLKLDIQKAQKDVKSNNTKSSQLMSIEEKNKNINKEVTSRVQTAKVDTELLKKMLKINEDSNKNLSKKVEKPKVMEPISPSVQNFFAQAKVSEKKGMNLQNPKQSGGPTYYTVQLLSYYQTLNLGCPRYQYIELPDKTFQAVVTLPDGQTVCGTPGRNKDVASDTAAAEALKVINNKTAPQKIKEKTSDTVIKSNKNAVAETSMLKINNTVDINLKGDPQDTAKNGQHLSNNKVASKVDGSQASNNADVNTKQNTVIVSSPFIPLQAVKKHRSRTASGSLATNVVKENKTANSNDHKDGTTDTVKSSKEQQTVTPSNTAKPRRERKMRIAANFPTAMAP